MFRRQSNSSTVVLATLLWSLKHTDRKGQQQYNCSGTKRTRQWLKQDRPLIRDHPKKKEEKESEREKDRDRQRQTDRQTKRDRDRDIERETETDRDSLNLLFKHFFFHWHIYLHTTWTFLPWAYFPWTFLLPIYQSTCYVGEELFNRASGCLHL